MPYKETKLADEKFQVTSPHGVKAKGTTKKKADAQMRLLRGVEHGWVPTGAPAKKKKEKTGHNLMGD